MWLFSKKMDLLTLYLPVWVCWVVLLLLPESILQADIPIWVWVLFVLGIDVGHVWSTIFRTYLDKQEFRSHRLLLIIAPIFSFFAVMGLAWYSVPLFWRALAYLAVFHFIKQQYGFLALYKSKAKDWGVKKRLGDKFIIYFATIYPIFYWHCTQDIQFTWFAPDDFIALDQFIPIPTSSSAILFGITNLLYWVVLVAWLIEEIQKSTNLQWGKLLWVGTTAVNWYGGIVYFNSDLAFTVTNVVAHGIPYLALIIYYNTKKEEIKNRRKYSFIKIACIVLPIVFLLAWIEEYWWDRLVYGDRPDFFGAILPYTNDILQQPLSLAIAIGILTLPQMTHYIIDGFIWRSNAKNPFVKQVFQSKS